MRARTLLLSMTAALAACSGGDGGGGGPSLDDRIANVNVVGTRIGDTFYADGSVVVTVVPLGADGKAILEEGFKIGASVVSPPGLSVKVLSSSCVQLHQRQSLATGIVVDDSSSMSTNDPTDASGPAPGRKAAARKLINAAQVDDTVALADFFGASVTPLRDLVCAATQAPPASCPLTEGSFTGDKTALLNATALIDNFANTPFYEACVQMANALSPQPQRRRAMVLLSDGLPSDELARRACIDAAHAANIAIYAIGFGQADATTLRELAESTGGSYAASSDASLVDRMVANMAFSEGSCTIRLALTGADQLADETPVSIALTIGGRGAQATFEFLAPRR